MVLLRASRRLAPFDQKKWTSESYVVILAEGEVFLIKVQSHGYSVEAVQSFNALTT